MKWKLKKFNDLSLQEFHDILQLRINIFVVEQNCPYPELDNKDQIACHFFGTSEEGKIVAYTRLFAPGAYYKEAAIGRVVVHKDYRKDGIGFELMKKSIEQIESLYKTNTIKIGAQTYLRKFYESLGFESTEEFYMEDGIPHLYMIKS
jgi:ElaA protein